MILAPAFRFKIYIMFFVMQIVTQIFAASLCHSIAAGVYWLSKFMHAVYSLNLAEWISGLEPSVSLIIVQASWCGGPPGQQEPTSGQQNPPLLCQKGYAT